jgi:hypothetical protein
MLLRPDSLEIRPSCCAGSLRPGRLLCVRARWVATDTYWEGGDSVNATIKLSWMCVEGVSCPAVSSVAVFVDRVKDPVLKEVALLAVDFSGEDAKLRKIDSCDVADAYVGWIVLAAKNGEPLTASSYEVALHGANRMRLRG